MADAGRDRIHRAAPRRWCPPQAIASIRTVNGTQAMPRRSLLRPPGRRDQRERPDSLRSGGCDEAREHSQQSPPPFPHYRPRWSELADAEHPRLKLSRLRACPDRSRRPDPVYSGIRSTSPQLGPNGLFRAVASEAGQSFHAGKGPGVSGRRSARGLSIPGLTMDGDTRERHRRRIAPSAVRSTDQWPTA